MRKLAPALLATMLLAGCLVAGPVAPYQWTLRAPASVVQAPHSKLHFTVETRTSDGSLVDDAPYVWIVDWVGIHGVEHQGRSFREERIHVKGEAGPAVLRILAHDGRDQLVEVARATILVTAPQP